MSIRVWSGLKAVVACVAMTLVAGCGGGGGSEPAPPDPGLPLMVDGLGRQVPEADFGHGDPFAAGAEGIAFDAGPIANAQVTLADSGGSTRTATTDAAGYYRIDIKNLQLPFLVKVKRADGSEWFSAGANSAITRGFVPININGLTDKVIGYVAEARSLGGGAASAVPAAVLSPPGAVLDPAKAKLRAALAVPLAGASLNPANYDPMALPVRPASLEPHASFLQSLKITKNAQGRTSVVALAAGGASALPAGASGAIESPYAVAVDGSGNLYLAEMNRGVIWKLMPDGKSSVLAGSSKSGFSDGAGSAAAFSGSIRLAADAAGNVYVADYGNHAIRKIDPSGMVTTLAGGVEGFADGTGASARFHAPTAVAVDAAGNVYVADYFNYAVRKISPPGAVTTVAGRRPGQDPCCDLAPDGVAVDGAGTVHVAFRSGVRRITPDGTVSDVFFPSGEASRWFTPRAIAADAGGTVYVTDVYTNRIHRITPGGAVSDLAAGGTAHSAIAVDAAGNLYVTDLYRNLVRKVTPAGAVSTVAGQRNGLLDGPGPAAVFDRPRGVAVDADGSIVVVDTGNDAIRRISRAGAVTTLAGGTTGGFADGTGAAARFNAPTGIAMDRSGKVFVADRNNNVIRKVTAAGVVTTFAGSGEAGFSNGAGTAASFSFPSHVVVDGDGNVYVSDAGNASVRKITAAGVVSTLAGSGRITSSGQLAAQGFDSLGNIAVDAQGTVYVQAYCGVLRPSPCTVTVAADGTIGRGAWPSPQSGASWIAEGGIGIQADGSLVVADEGDSTISIVLP